MAGNVATAGTRRTLCVRDVGRFQERPQSFEIEPRGADFKFISRDIRSLQILDFLDIVCRGDRMPFRKARAVNHLSQAINER